MPILDQHLDQHPIDTWVLVNIWPSVDRLMCINQHLMACLQNLVDSQPKCCTSANQVSTDVSLVYWSSVDPGYQSRVLINTLPWMPLVQQYAWSLVFIFNEWKLWNILQWVTLFSLQQEWLGRKFFYFIDLCGNVLTMSLTLLLQGQFGVCENVIPKDEVSCTNSIVNCIYIFVQVLLVSLHFFPQLCKLLLL